MQELLVAFITSLDGYGAAEGWPGWWGLEGPEYLAWLRPAAGTRLHELDGSEHVPSDVRIHHRIQGVGQTCPPLLVAPLAGHLLRLRTPKDSCSTVSARESRVGTFPRRLAAGM
jgi:hypothetical protein